MQYKINVQGNVETVILLSRKAPDSEIKVRLDMSESAESKATYKEIQEYVKK